MFVIKKLDFSVSHVINVKYLSARPVPSIYIYNSRRYFEKPIS